MRLVVYAGRAARCRRRSSTKKSWPASAPGSSTGELSPESQEKALAALRRYHLLIGHMGVKRTRVRRHRGGPRRPQRRGVRQRIDAIGFDCEVLGAEEEARLAGEGVLSAIPGADGIVGDLGGGSLELADVRGGAVARDLAAARCPAGRPTTSGERSARAILRPA